jgi:hypothetical protein
MKLRQKCVQVLNLTTDGIFRNIKDDAYEAQAEVCSSAELNY